MNMRSIVNPAVAFLAVCFALPVAAATQSPQTAAAYVEIQNYLPTWQQRDGWLDSTYYLKQNFDDVCGDTFCEGEYSNIEALRYRCSVNASTGIIGECVWVLAASSEEINADNGRVVVTPHIWQCVSPLAPSTRAEDLAAAFANNRRPMEVTLPNTNTTLHESLTNCLR